MEKFLRQFWKF